MRETRRQFLKSAVSFALATVAVKTATASYQVNGSGEMHGYESLPTAREPLTVWGRVVAKGMFVPVECVGLLRWNQVGSIQTFDNILGEDVPDGTVLLFVRWAGGGWHCKYEERHSSLVCSLAQQWKLAGDF